MKSLNKSETKLLAVASFGGHWIQLLRLRDMIGQYDATYVSCEDEFPSKKGQNLIKYFKVPDVSKESSKIKLIYSVLRSLIILLKVRPKVIISTGALPGFIMIVLAKKLFRCKTIWVDSIANGDQMSISGQHVKKFADIWLTQWEELAKDGGPEYIGRVI